MRIADQAERERALEPRGSFLVQAPAGSGKTELLIQRYLRLLAVVERPESVVAITFTRKASGEMRRRVLDALERAAGPQPERAHESITWNLACAVRARDRAAGWDLEENPHRLEIRTIDSLCYSLVSRMPWMSRMGGAPAVVEDARELYREAARRMVALLETDEWCGALGRLLLHVDNDVPALEALLAGMLEKRDQWLRHVGVGCAREELRAALEAALANVIRDALGALWEALPGGVLPDLTRLARFAAGNLAAAGRTGELLACRDLAAAPGREVEDLGPWLGIGEMLLTKEGGWRKQVNVSNGFPPAFKASKQELLALLAEFDSEHNLRHRLHALRRLPPPRFEDPQWEVVESLLAVLPRAAAELAAVFCDRSQVDFAHVILAALRALGSRENPTDLALSLDHRIEHLLVDEFQDTSLSQYELLEKLTAGWEPGDGRTLFLVGDPMQSIYRFREAEVGLFLKAGRDGIGQVRLTPLRLTVNFRSHREIVDWVNGAFPSVFPPADDIATGAVRFGESVAACPAGEGAAVHVHPFVGERPDRAEAEGVVSLVRAARERDAESKIAILVRARTHLPSILLAFREAGLPYRAVEIDCLGEVPVIQDLLALTRALLHAADRVSWLAVLRAPWCGLTLADLDALASAQPPRVVWEAVRDETAVAALSPDGQARLRRVRSVLEDSLASRRQNLRGWVEGTWIALGGPACVRGAADLENARAFFDLLEELDEGRDADLELLAERASLLYASPDPEAGETLQVMSIHKAKGLEFDVVVLPGLGRSVRADEAKLLMWLERPSERSAGELLLAPIRQTGVDQDRLSAYVRSVEQEKAAHEAGRLLYVAATRARRELHLLGHAKLGEKDGLLELREPAAGSLLAFLWPVVAREFEQCAAALAAEPDRVEPETPQPAPPRLPLRRLHSAWQMPAAPPAVKVAGLSETEGENAPETVTFQWVGDTLRHVGTVVHRVIEQIAREGAVSWDRERLHREQPLYEAALKTLGVPADELTGAVDKVERALVQTLADPRGAWILSGSHAGAESEYALTGVRDNSIVSARIDRTFVDENGIRWIVDFKTSAHEGGDREAFLDNERERYRARMEIYRRLFAQLDPRPIRMGLYFPLLAAWREYGEAGGAAAMVP